MERVQKILVRAGLGSRRRCEELIEKGKVRVNDKKISLGDKATEKDKIEVNGKEIRLDKKRYILLNKPSGYVTANSDQFQRTIMELINIPERVFPIGRLDKDVQGILLLTNDGNFANKIMHPRYNVEKTYYAKLDKPITKESIETILRGVRLKDGKVKGKIKRLDKKEVELTIHEGKNKIVKRIFKRLGYQVLRLRRIKIKNIGLRGIKVGKYRDLTDKEIETLLSKNG